MKNLSKKLLIKTIQLIRFFIKSKKLDIFFSKILSIKFKKNRLEITTTIGCALMCDYCPQTLIKSTIKKNENLDERIMTYENFKLYFENVPDKTVVHWSGYSEPLGNKNFKEFINYLQTKNYEQHISTTMFGRKDNEEFMSHTKAFKSVTFHLPDDSNLMKLKVGEQYLRNLEQALRFQCGLLPSNDIYIVVFGKNFHPQVENIIQKLINEKIISKKSIDIRDHIHTRNGEVSNMDKFRTDEHNFKEIKKGENKLYYCSYGRLDQGVILPNGDINLCCQDYSLKGVIGNLKNESLIKLYKQEHIYKKGFASGQYNLCKKCEYYTSL